MRTAITGALLTLAVAVAPLPASQSSQMHVSVEVIARTIFTVASQPADVTLTSNDVARGYVDVPSAISFQVRSNARNGYAVQFQPVAGPFTQAEVSWGTTTATVANDGSFVAQPYQQGTTFGSMSVRLSVAPGTQPGTYAWPVSVGANSL